MYFKYSAQTDIDLYYNYESSFVHFSDLLIYRKELFLAIEFNFIYYKEFLPFSTDKKKLCRYEHH